MKFINQQLIKDTNMKHLYTSIYHNPGLSRAHLSKQTALSKTTVSTLIDELIERNFILDGGAGESGTTGRKPNQLYLRRNSHFVVVFNWYENRIYTHLVDIAGTSVFQEACELKQGEAYVSASRNCFQNSVLQHCAPDEILGICVVIAAMIDEKHGEIYSTTISLPSMEGSQILDSLKEAFPDYPVDLLNDTACYSYAEKIYGGITEKNFAFINFGNRGIGASLFVDGSMLGKASGSFTQFGHYSVDPEGPLCVCGNHGCLEALIAEPRLKERSVEFGEIPSLNSLSQVTFSDLGKAATFRDPVALAMTQEIALELSLALSNLICTVNPSLIVLGGKIPDLGEAFLEDVRKNLKKTGFRRMVDAVQVRYSRLQSDSFLNGAMKYFFDIHYSFTDKNPSGFFIG